MGPAADRPGPRGAGAGRDAGRRRAARTRCRRRSPPATRARGPPAETDWPRIAALYAELARLTPSPVVELNRAVAVAMASARRRGWSSSTRSRPSRRCKATTCCRASAATCCPSSAGSTRPGAEFERAASPYAKRPAGACPPCSWGVPRRARTRAALPACKKSPAAGNIAAINDIGFGGHDTPWRRANP